MVFQRMEIFDEVGRKWAAKDVRGVAVTADENFRSFWPPGQEYYIKDDMWISWLTAADITDVNIELSTDSGSTWVTVAQNIDADNGWYEWLISGTPSSNCLIRISDADDASRYGISEQFTLLETPIITLNNPTGNEIWNTDSTYTISWTYNNPNAYYVYIDFSADNGQTWNYLGYSINENGQGSVEWTTPVVESDYYLIRVQDSYLDFVSDTSGAFAIRTFPNTPICIVSVDSATNKNIVVWDKPIDNLIDSFVVYKESDMTGIYTSIGTVDYNSSAVFIDTNSNPAVKSYRYRLGFSDADSNIYPMGTFHQTIHLSINKGVGGYWNLIWTDYLGIPVSTYNIYRSSEGTSYEMIGNISSSFNSFTDVNAPIGDVFYYIEVVNQNGCNFVLRNISSSFSNIATNRVLGIVNSKIDIAAQIYPNPTDNVVNLKLGVSEQSYNIQMVDLTGKVVLNEVIVNNTVAQTYKFSTSDLYDGFYFLKISTGKSTTARKLIVRH